MSPAFVASQVNTNCFMISFGMGGIESWTVVGRTRALLNRNGDVPLLFEEAGMVRATTGTRGRRWGGHELVREGRSEGRKEGGGAARLGVKG